MKRLAWLLLAMPLALFALGCGGNAADENSDSQQGTTDEPDIQMGEPMKVPPTGETNDDGTDNKPAEEKPADGGAGGTPTSDEGATKSEGTDGAATDKTDASNVDIEPPKNPKE